MILQMKYHDGKYNARKVLRAKLKMRQNLLK